MTREEAIKELSVEYLGDSIKARKAKDMAIEALQQQKEYVTKMDEVRRAYDNISKAKPCEDCVSRKGVHDMLENIPVTVENKWFNWLQMACNRLAEQPPVTPEKTTITYKDCSEAMLIMWIDNVLTDGQYNKIMDKLNAKHIEDMRGGKE